MKKVVTGKVGRPEADTDQITFRVENRVLHAIDDARRSVSDLPTRTEMIRAILTDWLRTKGYLK